MVITRNNTKRMSEMLMDSVEAGIPDPTVSTGILIFTKEDILKVKNPLSVMLRVLFVKNNVTHDVLTDRFREYAINILGEVPSRISTGKSNLLKAIRTEDVSFKKFYEVFVNILGYDLDLIFTLKTRHSNPVSYSYVESVEEIIHGGK